MTRVLSATFLLLLIVIAASCGGGDEGAAPTADTEAAAGQEGDVPPQESAAADAGPDGDATVAPAADAQVAAPEAAEDADASPGDGARLRTLPVTIYQRAATKPLVLKGAGARIVWFDAPVERARQIVRIVLDGVAARGSLKAAPNGVDYRDVHIDTRRTAWVDLTPESVPLLAGQDVEETLVACLAKTLVANLPEVERVGILVDGEPRRTLAGHVDLSRTFTGDEWPGG